MAKTNSAILSVRADPNSGRMSKKVKGALLPGGYQRIILVHGFNVDERAAAKNYEAFSKRLWREGSSVRESEQCCKFFWPGNEAGAFQSALSYSRQIAKARECGVLFGDYLREYLQKSQRTQIILICHSLGCRLVLEALKYITAVSPATASHIRLVVMMAAAVPASFIENRNFDVPIYAKKTACLYSPKDSILRYFFPIGQSMAGDGFYPTAIGLNGSPSSMWTAGHADTGLSHKAYWSSDLVATQVMAMLGTATARQIASRTIAARQLTTNSLAVYQRLL